MSNRFRNDEPSPFALNITYPLLPDWLGERLLRPNERVTWVRGPRFNPSWEIFVTNPMLFVFALATGFAGVFASRLFFGSWEQMSPAPFLVAGGLVIGSIYVLAFFSGYFTRLVVTDQRLFIVQGRELCRAWDLDQLPRSLMRYTRRDDGREDRTVDVNAVTRMLGGASDKFTDAKSIVAFGKQLEQIRLGDTHRQ